MKDESAQHIANGKQKARFLSRDLALDLRIICAQDGDATKPEAAFKVERLERRELLGDAATSTFKLSTGQVVYFVLRQIPKDEMILEQRSDVIDEDVRRAELLGIPIDEFRQAAHILRPADNPVMTRALLDALIRDTRTYWQNWIAKCRYQGRWREKVRRSALTLKMLVFEETGAIVAAPTFSLPEHIGGTRNWDYRFTWVRDTSFTIYALIRLGFTDEANAFVNFILERLKDRNSDGSLQM